mgnify:CR=1 FL=1
MFELDAIKINLTEEGRAIINELKKFGKEVSRDYCIDVPQNLEKITKQELHDWLMSVKDKILEKEAKQERKTTLCILLNSYLNSVNQYKSYVKKQESQKQPDMA